MRAVDGIGVELKQLWLDALRSGKYEQGRHALCKIVAGTKKYCCLGVLAEVAGLFSKETSEDGTYALQTSDPELTGGNGFLINEDGDHFLISREMQIALSRMNDQRDPFSDIADWIEREVPVYG